MATTVKTYKLSYENDSELKLEQSINGAEYTTVLEMTENGDIGDLLDQGIAASLKHFFSDKIDEIVSIIPRIYYVFEFAS